MVEKKCLMKYYRSTQMKKTSLDSPADSYYQSRFVFDSGRDGVWQALCRYLRKYISENATVLELGAGYCSFINQINSAERHALDISPAMQPFADPSVKTHMGSCEDLSRFSPSYFDVVFASNLFEHLANETVRRTLTETLRILKPGGRLILLQPNFKYAYREYFDDYTHVQIFTHVSLADLLTASGFIVEKNEPRFLPISMKGRLPKWPWLVRLYLVLPFRPLAKQMLLVARTPAKELN